MLIIYTKTQTQTHTHTICKQSDKFLKGMKKKLKSRKFTAIPRVSSSYP